MIDKYGPQSAQIENLFRSARVLTTEQANALNANSDAGDAEFEDAVGEVRYAVSEDGRYDGYNTTVTKNIE